ncbi:FGGY-family carbohydrate kinase [Rhizobium sp. L1K21]|uniref:FGGY-family carbohydrate kinase n=1 Tax=Rhizobium sp. L1K21 TaxID=2954933 RepID=UPI0020926853|nr:FGGY family carbohydrate kinase [Rhizobium sp. L1K21]MCO6188639.1 FGGY family carbohydrate kinase [Rhizobium sp. L1K21]
MPVVIGLDIGTTSTVAVAMEPSGKTIAWASRASRLSSPQPGFAEADPEAWWQNAQDVLLEVAGSLPAFAELAGICVTGMLPAVILLDENRNVLRPSIQQSDARCGKEVEALLNATAEPEFLRRTGQGITQQLVAPKLRWIARHEPDCFSRISHVLGSYDFINLKLTGNIAVERNWALEAGFIDLESHQIEDDLVALSGLPRRVLPPLVAAHEIAGHVTEDAAALTGLPVGLPVFGGAADHIASALAAGLTNAGDVLLKFGGAGDVIAIADKPEPDRRLFLDYHLIPGLYAPNGCMASTGSLLRWLAGMIGGSQDDDVLKVLDREAETIPAGADGVRALPYFLGEKTPIHDPMARGTLTGQSLGHERGHIWRAILESVACGFRHHLEVLEETDRPAARLLASDGGSRSRIWMQIVADICGQPVHALADAYGSSVGAAWVAAVGSHLASWDDVAKSTIVGTVYKPSEAGKAMGDVIYSDYRELYGALKGFFAREPRDG